MKIFTTLVIAVMISFSTIAQISSTEKQALIDLYTQSDGDTWTNSWDLNKSPEKSFSTGRKRKLLKKLELIVQTGKRESLRSVFRSESTRKN
jgi:3-hydroxyisobutyrate dehydrogenase-like beta-hydroxyacid dehydrogenase